ncbi:MAG: GNAT family N-acetyltransferase [Bryobacterales bacterium]|nr:GNAT family N-acetyltransferase [Bryobacterales bacterium]
MSVDPATVYVRETRESDFPGITALCQRVYPNSPAWQQRHLASHQSLFPEGQFVAVRSPDECVVGMAASLILRWDDYEHHESWLDFTERGMFTNHDPELGRTLYGAEVMVDPASQRMGIGRKLYRARSALVRRLGLLRIRAGARLRGYSKHAGTISAEQYVRAVVRDELKGPTLSFQLREGFRVFDVVSGYLPLDPESLGWAALIEWLNPEVALPHHFEEQNAWLRRRNPIWVCPDQP